ncbi:UNVERIFIED_CONTAM: GNAT superfamily N-acetyltransferase [Brevibacillus sp. OAP136]
MYIKLLTEQQELREAFPVMKELRTHLTEDSYLELLDTMKRDGYRLYALYADEQITALAGVAIRTNFYYKKHVFVYDLITRAQDRSKGYGELLLGHVHELAKQDGCEIVALESGLHRTDAHRFYETKMGYERFCYSFKKMLL